MNQLPLFSPFTASPLSERSPAPGAGQGQPPAPPIGAEAPPPEDAFGPVIYSYTRRQALADGFQVDVSETAREAGIRFPVFLNRTVWEAYVTVPAGLACQDERGRLWDIIWMLRFAMLRAPSDCARVPVVLRVKNDERAARLVKLVAMCGPLDMDDPQPAVTVMLPDED